MTKISAIIFFLLFWAKAEAKNVCALNDGEQADLIQQLFPEYLEGKSIGMAYLIGEEKYSKDNGCSFSLDLLEDSETHFHRIASFKIKTIKRLIVEIDEMNQDGEYRKLEQIILPK